MNESEMKTVIDLPNFPNICRICLGIQGLQLFSDYLVDVFKTITSIEVENDGFPLYMCRVCLQKLEEITDFVDMARYNDTEYTKTWMRRKKLKEVQILNRPNDAALLNNHSQMTEVALLSNHSRITEEALSNNHSPMKEPGALRNNHSKMTARATPLNTYSEKNNEAVLLDSDSEMTDDAVISNNPLEPTIKSEFFSMGSDITKEETLLDTASAMTNNSALTNNHYKPTGKLELLDPYSLRINQAALLNVHSQMTNELSSNVSEATVKLEVSNIDSELTSEAILLNTHSEVTNEVILLSRQGSKTKAATFFSNLYDSTCSSNSMDQNSGVVTITDNESESESRDLSFISHLEVGNGNFREGPERHQSTDKSRKPRHRHVYTRNEILELEKEFIIDPFTSGVRRAEIAASLGISQVQVKVWFQNRRMKQRKEEEKINRINHEEWKKHMILDRVRGMEPQNFSTF